MVKGGTYEDAVRADYYKYINSYNNFDYSVDVSDDITSEEIAKKVLELVGETISYI